VASIACLKTLKKAPPMAATGTLFATTTDDPQTGADQRDQAVHRIGSGAAAARGRRPAASCSKLHCASRLPIQVSLSFKAAPSPESVAIHDPAGWHMALLPAGVRNRETMGERCTDAERPKPTASHD
jgi:hypothetical protein